MCIESNQIVGYSPPHDTVDKEQRPKSGIDADRVSSLPATLRDYSSSLVESEADIIRAASRVVLVSLLHSRFPSKTKKRRAV